MLKRFKKIFVDKWFKRELRKIEDRYDDRYEDLKSRLYADRNYYKELYEQNSRTNSVKTKNLEAQISELTKANRQYKAREERLAEQELTSKLREEQLKANISRAHVEELKELLNSVLTKLTVRNKQEG